MRTGKNTGRKELALAVLAALVLFFCFFGAASARAETYQLSEDTSKWAGTLTNLKFDPVIKPNFDLRYDGKTFIGIPIPTLVFSVKLGLGVESDFDLDIRQGTMQGITEESWITENTPGLSHEKISNNITDYLPTLFTVGVKIETYLRVGATAPVKLKGKFKNNVMIELSSDTGVHKSRENSVEFTSVRPQTPNKKVFFYVGTDTSEFIGIGEINFLLIKFGPLLDGGVSISNGALGFATLEKDQIDLSNVDEDPGHYIGSIHTCLENGKDGCVTGSWRMMDQMTASLRIHLVVEIFWQKLTIYEHTWPLDEAMNRTDLLPFVQSLTWGEPAKILQEKCDHIVYQVPAIVYYDHEHKIVARNWNSPIHPTDNVQVDPNVRSLTSRVPRNGQTNLFLPWKDGRYTLTTDNGVFAATEAQPSYMVREKNAQVPLVLESKEKRVFTAKKEWDIDMEDKDRPKSIQVVLQRSSYNDGKRIMHEYYQRDPSILWKSVDIIELNEENNWTAQFDPVPVYELDEYGIRHKYKYRVRELREATEEEQENSLEDANKRVVPNRWDLDNIRLVDVLKDKLTSFDTYWSLPLTEDGIKAWLAGYATDALFSPPEVAFTVPEYTNLVGETVEEHETRYRVEYEEEEGDEDENPRKTTVTIKNTAILSINIYKRWIGLGNTTSDDIPPTVYIALLSRPQQSYLEHLPATVQRYAGLWLPVFKPLSGDNVNLLSIVGLDFLAKLDVAGLLKIPIAVAKVEKPEDGSNPLTAWKCGFVVKKYGALGIPGIPVEFEGAELSSVVIQDLIKFLTGLDIPISIGIQGFVTVPGKAYQIPVLDKDWEKTSNIMNIQASPNEPSGDDPGAVAIGGAKHWVNDQPSDRPESITLHIKDGETKIADLVLKRSVNGCVSIINKDSGEPIGNYPAGNDENTWLWALKQSNVPGVTLDPHKTYTVTEDPVGGYITSVDGHEITNTWVKGEWPTLLFRKVYDGRIGSLPREVVFKVTAPDQDPRLIPLYELVKKDGVFEAKLKLPEIGGADPMEYCSRISVEELPIFSQGYEVTRSGPDPVWDSSGLTYVFTITNRAPKEYELVIRKEWTDDSEGDRPASVSVKLYRDGVYWQTVSLSKTRNWSWEASGDVLRKVDGTMYEIKAEEEVPEGYSSTLSRENSVTSAGRHRTTITLTNKKKPTGNITVTGTKTWVDDGNQDQTRPDKITIHVRNSNNETVQDLEVSADASGNWTWSVSGLPEKDENGNALSYSVTEDPVAVSGAADTYYTTTYETPSYKEADQTWTCNITNTHPNKTTLIKVEKVWNDGNNQHGQRPESVRIRIYETPSGGTKKLLREVELDARSGWQTAFMTEKKEGAVYSAEEDPVFGYDRVSIVPAGDAAPDGNNTVSFTITNRLRTEITVEKVWNDDNNARGIRPAAIFIVLYNPQGKVQAGTYIRQSDEWKHTFTASEAPLWDEDGNQIIYTLKEDYVPKYDGVVTGSAHEGFVITNTPKARITITKVWNDNDDEGGFRPESVTLRLNRTDSGAVYSQIIQKPDETSDEWVYYVNPDVCPAYDENGRPISYTLTEDAVPNYQSGVITGSAQDGFTVTNTPKAGARITKVWDDDGNPYGDRPGSVTVHVKNKGDAAVPETDVILSASKGWTTMLPPDTYPIYGADGHVIEYELTESPVAKYHEGVVSGSAKDGYTITNTPKKRITIRKVWNDKDNAENTRPTQITVYVRGESDGHTYRKEQVISAENDWVCTLDPDLYPVYGEDGQAISYRVEESKAGLEEYVSAVTGNAEEGFTVTNSLKDRITLTKRWVDGDYEGRPESVSVFLRARGQYWDKEVVLEESENWTVILNAQDYPVFATYTVREEPLEGYTFSYVRESENSIVVTNTRKTIDITVHKAWKHGANPRDQRPDAVTVQLKKGTEVIDTATLSAENSWQYTFEDLPYLEGSEKYTVVEANVPQGYTPTTTQNGDGKTEDTTFTITNTFEKQKLDVAVVKIWDDNGKAIYRRPITVQLKKENSSDVISAAELNAANSWSYTFADLPVYENEEKEENPITYTVVEATPLDEYDVSVIGNQEHGFTIINTLKKEITIKKVWNDNNDAEHHRPASVTVHLSGSSDGHTYDKDLELKADSNWSCTLNPGDFPVYGENGQVISYTVTELLPEGTALYYQPTYIGNAEEGFTVINTYHACLSITKRWIDGNYTGRPESVTVYIKKNGGTEESAIVLEKDKNWTTTLNATDYPVSDTYEVTEKNLNGYTYSATRNNNSIVITNIRATMVVYVSKNWKHGANPESKRPKSVTVKLKKGKDQDWEVLREVTLSAENSWQYTFDYLPFLNDGTEYKVEEVNVPQGYTPTMTQSGNGKTGNTTFTITNTFEKLKLDIPVKKIWDDDDASYRPTFVTVRIEASNDSRIFKTIELNAAHDWSGTFSGMQVYYDPETERRPIIYVVKETASTPSRLSIYDSEVTGDQVRGFTITNTAKKINIRVNKIWDDDNNALGNRPEWVQITLRGNGFPVLSSYLAPDSANEWTCLFENLPKYEDDGQEISYSLVEYDVPGYTDSWVYAFDPATNTGTFTLTNKASRERINLVIQKQWAGEGEWREEYRPSEVKVTIAGGGKEYPVTLKASEGWKATLTDLPRYVNGKEANYFLNEWDVNGYWASAEMSGPVTVGDVTTFTYTLTNTLITTDIPVTKYWLDEETSHPPVTFVLYSNRDVGDEDVEVGRLTLTEEDAKTSEPGSPWKGRFTNLPVYAPADGRPILYTLQEEPVEGYVAPIILRESEQESTTDPTRSGFIHTSFEAYNFPEPRTAEASVIKLWEDDDNAKGIRPREVITHLWNKDDEVAEILLTGEDGSYGEKDDLPLTDAEGRKIDYTLTEEALECYDSEIRSVELEIYDSRIYLFVVQNTLRDDACVLTYDPNGGILEGSKEPLKEGHRRGETVSIHRAPEREGYIFLYWKGSEYQPGDDYTVTGDHTFIAQWVREDALDHKFTFTKRWSGTPGESIDWTLFDAEGNAVSKRFNKKIVSDIEWQYTAWFESPREYYLIEKPVPGCETIYQNVGKYADVKDRCYNGGTIVNYRAPNTGDESRPLLWVALGAAGVLLLTALLIKHRRKR